MRDQCATCDRTWGTARACQFCRQVEGLPEGIALASPIRRFCGYLIEPLLMMGSLVIGYLIWMCFTFRVGQTPGKKLLGMRVVSLNRKQATTFWGTLLREAIAKPIIGAFGTATAGLIYLWLIWDRDNQELWDKIVGSVVVYDPQGATLRSNRPSVAPAIDLGARPVRQLPSAASSTDDQPDEEDNKVATS